jgi:CspA family cold shock protein
MDGTVKRVVHDRGFGFIATEDGTEYFFHRSSLADAGIFDSLRGGEAVAFDVERGPKGPRAAKVQVKG